MTHKAVRLLTVSRSMVLSRRGGLAAQDEGLPDAVDVAIGARIRSRRVFLKMSQTELGARIGVSFQQVQKYERGVNRVSGSKLVAIAAVLDSAVGWLVGEEAGSGGETDVFAALAVPGALEIAKAFAEIPSSRLRAHLLALARDMGRGRA
ncbi:MAG: helix-turn-helix transcriptional regulator [Phenylobacterium sp.]